MLLFWFQVSPVQENVILPQRPWYERYQPISYKFDTRSGNETEFRDMVRRCNHVGVRTYVDVIMNHMTGINTHNVGTGGSTADPFGLSFPGVPFSRTDFNWDLHPCQIGNNYHDPIVVRNCELLGLRDLNQGVPYVRMKIIGLLNRLVDIGVAGFRVDAAKHMWPTDLRAIYGGIKNLSSAHGFLSGSSVYIAQEVIDMSKDGNNEAIRKYEYTPLAPVTEFLFSSEIGKAFRGQYSLRNLEFWGLWTDFLHTEDALVFVDNHDNQRGHGAGGSNVLTYHNSKQYKMATAWALAHPYGNVRIMSSFRFDRQSEQNQGPPQDSEGNLISPSIKPDGTCGNGWICEHRWRQIFHMINFRNVVGNASQSRWWSNGNNQIAICRGNRGFAVWNNQWNTDLNQRLNTCLPAGEYCDIISGQRQGNLCTGQKIIVVGDGNAHISLRHNAPDGVLAFHVGPLSKL